MSADYLEALELADATLRGANMDRVVVERKLTAAIQKARGEQSPYDAMVEALRWAVDHFDGNTRCNAKQEQNCIEKCREALARATGAGA